MYLVWSSNDYNEIIFHGLFEARDLANDFVSEFLNGRKQTNNVDYIETME